MGGSRAVFLVVGISLCLVGDGDGAPYLGKLVGKLSELHHGVSGEVYAVDARTLYIKDFTYDGQGPAAYFYASTLKGADKNGFRLRDETGSGEVIRRYRREGVTLTLPEGKTLHGIKIFYVWCEEFDVNFGDVKIPRNFDYPRPQKIDALTGVHSISSDNIVIVDAQTLLIPNLSYDGEAPDAKFWVGRGPKPSPQGIRVPDENGKEVPLRRYDRKTIVLTLPGDLTVFDIGHFGIWCEMFTVDFGHVVMPSRLNIPPSLKMLGVSPQKLQYAGAPSAPVQHSRPFVGGHLQATTFRPPSFFSIFGRKNDQQNSVNYVHQQPNDILPKSNVQYNQFNVEQSPRQPVQYQPFPHTIQQPQNQLINQQHQFQQLQQQQLLLQQQQLPIQHQHVPQYSYVNQIKPQVNYAPQQSHDIDIKQSISLPLPQQNFGQEPANLRQHNNIQQDNRIAVGQDFGQYNGDNRRSFNEQLAYNQFLQQKKYQDEQLRIQLERQYNRFQLNGNQNGGYTPLG